MTAPTCATCANRVERKDGDLECYIRQNDINPDTGRRDGKMRRMRVLPGDHCGHWRPGRALNAEGLRWAEST